MCDDGLLALRLVACKNIKDGFIVAGCMASSCNSSDLSNSVQQRAVAAPNGLPRITMKADDCESDVRSHS